MMSLRSLHITISMLLLGIVPAVAAEVIEVCPSCPVSDVQSALETASPHDTILVKKGRYLLAATLIIRKPLVIKGQDHPVLDGKGQHGILEIHADDVTIEGLVMQNIGKSYLQDRAAILIEGVKDFTIRNNRIYNCFFAVLCKKSAGGTISGNLIRGNAVNEFSSGNAIHLWYCKKTDIRSNRLSRHRDGIYLEFVDSSRISGNISENNLRYGLHFMFSNHNIYQDNTFSRNGAGVAVMFSKNIQMLDNLFSHNWGPSSYGLLLKEIYDGKVSGNRFYKNTVAIYAEGAGRMHFERNHIGSNGWALRISGSSMDNEFIRNDFTGNTFNVSTNTSSGKNTYRQNYWSDYRGYDLDRDGTGDVPHRPVSLFAYLAGRIDASVILMRSNVITLMDWIERVLPAVTPVDLLDEEPLMKPYFK